MAYWVQSAGSKTRSGYRLFYMDSDADATNLPTTSSEGAKQDVDSTAHRKCSVGSESLCISTGDVYVLNSSDEWKKL